MKQEVKESLVFIPKDQKTVFVPKIKKTEFSYKDISFILLGGVLFQFLFLYTVNQIFFVRASNNLKEEILEIDSLNGNIYPEGGILETIVTYSEILNSQYKLNLAINDVKSKVDSSANISGLSYIKSSRNIDLDIEVPDIGLISSQLEKFRESEYLSSVSYQNVGSEERRNASGNISIKFILKLK